MGSDLFDLDPAEPIQSGFFNGQSDEFFAVLFE